MYDFILIKGDLLVMFTWPELHTYILCMKRKSVKEKETRVNTLLNQFTYKLQKNKNNNKTTQIYMTYPTLKERKRTYRRSFRKLKI